MMMRTTLAAVTLAAAPAFGQVYVDWDVDTDGVLAPGEFHTGIAEIDVHEGLDGDGDGLLTEAEWQGRLEPVGEFELMDLNADGGVDGDEFSAILFNRYDADGSGRIDAAETADLHMDIAKDGLLMP